MISSLINRLPLLLLLPLLPLLIQPVQGQGMEGMHHERQAITLPGSPANLPYSAAIRVGHMLYLSGQVGMLPGTRTLVSGGIEAETRQVMENIQAVLRHAGSSLARAVKCTVFLADMNDYDVMNRIYAGFFTDAPPARSTFAVAALPFDARVEIECTALVGEAM